MTHRHPGSGAVQLTPQLERFALVGSPNAGKTTLFNGLTGLRAKTGNYPGVTMSRYEGVTRFSGHELLIEDLPGTYSLDPISPDESIVSGIIDPEVAEHDQPRGLLALLDATSLRRSLGLLAQLLTTRQPVAVVLTFTDELARRQGRVDVAALSRALGLRVIPVISGRGDGVRAVQEAMVEVDSWPAPAIVPPSDHDELRGWVDSVLAAAGYQVPEIDSRTRRIDGILLHPVSGTLIFLAVMYAFFQIIFTVAAPMQDQVEAFFGWLGGLASERISIGWLSSFVSDALLGGLGGVLVFLPQIMLLFVMIALMEGTGYMSRAAFLMDRVMARAGLEGRAFVALLSSVACAIPGIMATRSLPSAKDRIATIMAAPLMTCSARLPVYVMLIALLVSPDAKLGPFGAQGTIMFGLYLLGAVSAMSAAWVFKRIGGRSGTALPFYMEMPSYRLPSLRTVTLTVWESSKAFLRKVTSIIMITTIVMWALLNLPLHSDADMLAAGVDPTDEVAASAYVIDNSLAASVGNAVEPVFEPLGFDWRINIGVLSSLAAREVFVATLGQVAAAQNPDDPGSALQTMTVESGARAGEKLFDTATVIALLVFFVYAMQCMSTLGVIRRETGTWRWSLIAFGYLSVLAWVMAFAARSLTLALL